MEILVGMWCMVLSLYSEGNIFFFTGFAFFMGKTGTDPVTENGENPLIKKKDSLVKCSPLTFRKTIVAR